MPYNAWDEYFVHQLPRPFDHVNDTAESWSDRCYFNVHSPDGTLLVTTGYGNNPEHPERARLREGRARRRTALGPRFGPAVHDRSRRPLRGADAVDVRRAAPAMEARARPERVGGRVGAPLRVARADVGVAPDHDPQAGAHDRRHDPHQAARSLHGVGERRRRADLGRRFPRWTRPHVRHPRVGARRLLALVRGRVRGPRDRGVGVGVVRRHGPVRRRRHHVRGRVAVVALRRLRARRDLRRRRQASGARRHRLHRRGRSDDSA